MNSLESELEWSGVLNKWHRLITRLYDAREAALELKGKIPGSWIELLGSPDAGNIKRIWVQATSSLPKFIEYLSWAILDARVAESNIGFLLIYKLKAWKEGINYYGEQEIFYEDDYTISGSPINPDEIGKYEKDIGQLPAALKDLWSIHGFIELRDRNLLFSIDKQQQQFTGFPRLFTSIKDEYSDDRLSDCLSIAYLNGETLTCISRPAGSSTWTDQVVYFGRITQTINGGSKSAIDDLLSNWLFNEWPHPDI